MEIYIKPMEKAQIIGRRLVYLKDVAEALIGGQTIEGIGETVVLKIPKEKDATYLLSVIDVIRAINRKYPDATVSNVGETDILVEYHTKPPKKNKALTILKVAAICLVLFAGGATTIMCYHSDNQLPLIFQNYYYMFFGENVDTPFILSVPYSIGLAMGVIIFFNHFSKASLTDDPTPIEVEMSTYEKETNAGIVDKLNKKGKG